MTGRKWLILGLALGLMAGGAGLLVRLKAIQRLGRPGVKVIEVGTDGRLQIQLPEKVLEGRSTNVEATELEVRTLPRDTTVGKRIYRLTDGFQTLLSVVLMGTDRTSIHKPEFCLTSQGWNIVQRDTTHVRVTRPRSYDLTVRRFIATAQGEDAAGRPVQRSGVYVFWFAAENRLTASHWSRVGWITWELLRHGVLPRWAYVTCFSTCPPGQEDATFERMKEFLAAAVPEFQTVLPPSSEGPRAPQGSRTGMQD